MATAPLYIPPPMRTIDPLTFNPMEGPSYAWQPPVTPAEPGTTPAPSTSGGGGPGTGGVAGTGQGNGAVHDNGGHDPHPNVASSGNSSGFAPGRFLGPLGSTIAGMAPYGVGTAINGVNSLMGVQAEQQQADMLGINPGWRGVVDGALGTNLSGWHGGVGGYGNLGVGGYTGAQNMADPGVMGAARALSATQVAGYAASHGGSTNAGSVGPSSVGGNMSNNSHSAHDSGGGSGGNGGNSGGVGGNGPAGGQGGQGKNAGFAQGGAMPQTPWFIRSAAREVYHNGGLFHSAVPGRTDRINASVPGGSYVIPADVVSGLGEGNTMAGANVLDKMMHTGPGGMKLGPMGHGSSIPHAPAPLKYADGGRTPRVPIVVAGGEYLVHPDDVRRVGNGSINHGHDRLDHFVKAVREHTAKKLKALPGPKKD
jgi:hypothetical protein